MTHRFVATAARGTEAVLAEELREMGLGGVAEGKGAVRFEGAIGDGYRAVMWSRVASRVLLAVADVDSASADALYEGARAVTWTDHLDGRRTFAVDLVRTGETADNPRFLTLRVKDAIVDSLRDALGTRPDVDTKEPDVRIHVHVAGGRASISIDLAGGSLHRRGRGTTGARAPLKESLAAALLRIADWPRLASEEVPFVDPMCGSATLCAEAAAIALDLAPGLGRARHGFDGWLGHDAAVWDSLRREAIERRDAARDRKLAVHGWDASSEALEAARKQLDRMGLGGRVSLARRTLADASPPSEARASAPRGLLVTNPPYGERLGEAGELGPLYEQLGDILRTRFVGWHAWVLSGNRALDKRIGLRAVRRHVVFNGPIECRFLDLPIADRPVHAERGPGWRKPSPESEMLENRLRKNLRRIGRWAEREGIGCYRLYDADIKEYNLAIDVYESAAVVQEYDRPRSIDAETADRHVRDAMTIVPSVLGLDPKDVTLRVRRRRRESEQYERRAHEGGFRIVHEDGLAFRVNLTDYLDTGLFLDHRRIRAMIRARARDRDFLNLFAYTCTATVHAAAGGARSTTSVDLSKTYLDWGRENLALNGFEGGRHALVRADCIEWLRRAQGTFDLIFCAPPTWSRSKGMKGDFDVQRDHAALIRACADRLAPGGELVFSTPGPSVQLDRAALAGRKVEEITEQTVPFDFAKGAVPHRAWRVT